MSSYFSQTSFPLAVMYTIVALTVGFQLSKIFYYRHNIFSFQCGFLLLGFVWAMLRTILWYMFPLLTVNGWSPAGRVLFYLPVNLQFATFSLFVLFFAHLVHKASWERSTRARFMTAYIATNALFLVLQIIWIVSIQMDVGDVEELQMLQTYFVAAVFFVLAVILAWYGWRLRRVLETSKIAMQAVIPPRILAVTFILSLLFISRALWNILSAAGVASVPLVSGDPKEIAALFFLLFIWEILPTMLVLLLFWRIPRTNPRRNNIFVFPSLTQAGQTTMPAMPRQGPFARGFSDEREVLLPKGANPTFSNTPSIGAGTGLWGSLGPNIKNPAAAAAVAGSSFGSVPAPYAYSTSTATPPSSTTTINPTHSPGATNNNVNNNMNVPPLHSSNSHIKPPNII